MKTSRTSLLTAAGLLVLGAAAAFLAGRSFLSMRAAEAIHPAPGLTRQALLSDYFPALAGTPGDTDVYVFEGPEAGGTVLVTGGAHPNEPAGFIAAVVLVENLRALRGRVVVIPRANASGFTCNDPQEANPQRFTVPSRSGPRQFRLGSRLSNPVHQWPDPTLYENPAGQMLSASEVRNLNRCYPGRPRGYLTERTAFGIMEVIRRERVDLGIDLHESAPEYPVINAIVFHDDSAELAALAQMSLQDEGLDFRLEASPQNLRGLSHREWGDAAGIKALLIETPNPVQGRLKGRTTAALVVEGKDKAYLKAARLGRLFVPYDEKGIPLEERVARHLAAISAILRSQAEVDPAKAVEVEGLPGRAGILEDGLGPFLR
ncbi:MAG TPA: succinylglutamate desuccinylase [Candidatus Aminicenantes bacterium]|nr:succinylglutamate desuccinylase [Candidatus Aminicenantes bacterium]HRY66026.1 succinylglutamate desuccinylase [Candidatus Aminicenantes bacterium]HRZ72925.1 succinylglutamate desuccinylase [Candidatus Aminicenantes bacterium]